MFRPYFLNPRYNPFVKYYEGDDDSGGGGDDKKDDEAKKNWENAKTRIQKERDDARKERDEAKKQLDDLNKKIKDLEDKDLSEKEKAIKERDDAIKVANDASIKADDAMNRARRLELIAEAELPKELADLIPIGNEESVKASIEKAKPLMEKLKVSSSSVTTNPQKGKDGASIDDSIKKLNQLKELHMMGNKDALRQYTDMRSKLLSEGKIQIKNGQIVPKG